MPKQRRFLPILLLAACMLALTLWALWNQSGDFLGQIQFQDQRHGQELDLYYDRDQDCYVLFLPSFTDPQDITHAAPRELDVTYDLTNALEKPVALEVSGLLRRQQFKLKLMQLSEYPNLFIHAEEGLIGYLNEDKDNAKDVVVQVLDGQGQVLLQNTASMYGRGNGSWESPSKKPYNLEFAQPVSVGPFQDVTKLCMLAEFSDESRMRNSLAYFAGQELGIDYASPYQYANVYVNGEFLGLYGLVTKQEYQKHLEEDEIQAVFEIATAPNRVEFFSPLGWRINVIHGSKTQVQQLVNGFEEALIQKDLEACEAYINTESFARKYALEEFLANLDLAYGSQYFYVDRDGKINCMLPWDYDWTLGSSYEYFNNRQAYELKVYRDTNSWYFMLMDHWTVRLLAASIWETEFDDAFLRKLEQHLQEDIETIAGSWACEKLRWKYEEPYNVYDLSSGVTELEEFYDLFRDYFYQRRDYLVHFYSNWWDYKYLAFYGARWGNLIIPAQADVWEYLEGATLLDVNTPGEKFLGWYVADAPLEEAAFEGTWIEVMGMYEELPVEAEYDLHWWLELVVLAGFGAMALGLFLTYWKRLRKRGANGRKEKVPTRV